MFLLSGRLDRYQIIPRIIIAAFILLMPNLGEIHAHITGTQWYLAVWLFMIIIASPPEGVYWKIHDYAVLIMAGLTGPFAIFLIPVVMLKKSKINAFGVIFALICIIQAVSIITTAAPTRYSAPLGADISVLANILSSQIFLGFLLSPYQTSLLWQHTILNYMVFTACAALIAVFFMRGDWRQKSMVIFPFLMLAFALAKPQLDPIRAQWPVIGFPNVGERYFLITNIFWVAILLSMLSVKSKRLTAAFFVLILVSGVCNFKLPRRADKEWFNQVYAFKQLPSGESMIFQIPPEGWEMTLNKK